METPAPSRRTPEYRDVDAELFRTRILPGARPAVLRGVVADWPAVVAGLRSPQALAGHLRGFDAGGPVDHSGAQAPASLGNREGAICRRRSARRGAPCSTPSCSRRATPPALICPRLRGVQGRLSPAALAEIRTILARTLSS